MCCVVCVVFVCWLRLDFVPLSVALGALGSLRLLSILTIHSACSTCFRFLALAFHPYNSFCLLSAPLSIVACSPLQLQMQSRANEVLGGVIAPFTPNCPFQAHHKDFHEIRVPAQCIKSCSSNHTPSTSSTPPNYNSMLSLSTCCTLTWVTACPVSVPCASSCVLLD
jgi:hypothetical protein